MFFKKKKKLDTIDLPDMLKGMAGIFAAPVTVLSLDDSFSGTVLCLQDEPKNISDLSRINNLHMEVKVIGVNTSCGRIIVLLFVLWDIRRQDDKFAYEVLLNPSDKESYVQYIVLDSQMEWQVLLIEGKNILNSYQFKNVFHIGEPIKRIIASAIDHPCLNFMGAKQEYFEQYSIDEFI